MIRNPEGSFLSLSVFELKAAKLLRAKRGVLRWTDGSSVRVEGGVDQVKLNGEQIDLEYTRLHSGGLRPWFICPVCAARCARLFLSAVWACRVCSRVGYISEQLRPGPMHQVHRVDERIMAGRWPYLERKLLERRQRLVNRIRRME